MSDSGTLISNFSPSSWPVLKTYDQQHLLHIAMPIGGIGTGTVSLGGRGNLQDWEVVNRPAKGFTPRNTFFALYTRESDKPAVTRVLEGSIDPSQYEGSQGSNIANHNLPRFRHCQFHAAYPLGQVTLRDPDIPVAVRLQAFNPLIPPDPDKSGIPLAVLRFVLVNQTEQEVAASICGSLQNFIGADGSQPNQDWVGRTNFEYLLNQNRNEFRKNQQFSGMFMTSDGLDDCKEAWGTLALATISDPQHIVSYRTLWPSLSWGDSLLDFWDDFSQDGQLEDRQDGQTPTLGPSDWFGSYTASLATGFVLSPKGTHAVTFLLAWHFPNRQTWTPIKMDSAQPISENSGCSCQECDCHSDPNTIGNYYTTQYRDAWDVLLKTVSDLPALEAGTVEFVNTFLDADLPPVVKEAALFNLSSLRSQTCFRTPDGNFFGYEGCNDHAGCCHGSCTHVWNYEQATPFLFGSLARSMRQVEFKYSTSDKGLMSFRTNLPLHPPTPEEATRWGKAAADGQMGCLMKLYRDWQLSGDETLLLELWPKAKKALEFCWIPGGWDADQDGVMEGCQHNTMDVEYYGPNPQMGIWYLGALRAMQEIARHLGEMDFASHCNNLFENGKKWIDSHLFNGEYYEHEIRPPANAEAIAGGLRIGAGATNLDDPELQLGAGCLVDQLVGQYMAHVCGLGYMVDADHIQQTLQSLMRYNFHEDFYGHFNQMRSYVLNDEAGLVMASYPHGQRPKRPFPYYNEVMTGFEYCAGVHMLYEGEYENGLKVIQSIRNRYDGLKRSPFDEAECGHHYARAMASWAAVLALTGFHYSAVEKSMTFAPMQHAGQWFWSTGDAWGICHQNPQKSGVEINIEVKAGQISLQKLTLGGFGSLNLGHVLVLRQGDPLKGTISFY